MENILVSLFKGYADTCPIEVPLKTIISLLRDNQAVTEHTKKHRYYLAYIIHSGFISGYQNRYGDNLKPPTNVYHRMTA